MHLFVWIAKDNVDRSKKKLCISPYRGSCKLVKFESSSIKYQLRSYQVLVEYLKEYLDRDSEKN